MGFRLVDGIRRGDLVLTTSPPQEFIQDEDPGAKEMHAQAAWRSQSGVGEEGHLAMTYSALATLMALGDKLECVDVEATVLMVKSLQEEDGRYCQ